MALPAATDDRPAGAARAVAAGDGTSPVGRAPGLVVLGRTARSAVRSGVLWGYVFGAYVASSALGYAAAYKTPASRHHLAQTLGADVGVSAIIGPARAIDTVAGFTAWRVLGVASLVGAVWGIFAATRLTRGEEDAGRWELLLSGQTTRRGAAVQALGGLGAGVVALWGVTAVISVVAGRAHQAAIAAPGALFMAIAAVAGAAVFLSVGAFAAQLAPTRRRANGYAAAALGVSYGLRMVADSGAGLAWLRWCTPLGWVEELRPLAGPRPFALVPIGALVGVLVACTVAVAARRDLGASALADGDAASPRTRLLRGPAGLAVRIERGTALGWATGLAAMGIVLGLVAQSAGSTLEDTSVSRFLSRLGGHGTGAALYLGVSFVLVATMVVLLAAGQMAAAREEEADGRLDHLLVRPVGRVRWLGGRLAVAAAMALGGGVLAGVATLAGAASQHTGVGAGRLLEAGVNVVPPALFVLGLGALALGWWPRATASVSYAVAAWSLLVELVGGAIDANHWLLDTSVLHHVAPAPALPPNWVSAGVLCAAGLAMAGLGAARFARRDLQSA